MSSQTSPVAKNPPVDLHRYGEFAFPIERSRADDVLARMGLVADPHPDCDSLDHLLDHGLNRTDPDAREGSKAREDRWPTDRIL